MKLLLVNPVQYDDQGLVPKYQYAGVPPLGLITVASLLRDNPAVDVTIVNEFLDDVPFEGDYDLVGIGVTFTSVFPRAVDISRRFRERGIPVVMGGVHVTCNPATSAPHADALVLGEAEGVFPALIDDFLATGKLKPVYGGDPAMRGDSFDSPLPNYDLLDMDRYFKIGLFRKSNYFSLETSRGCPMSCDFCSVRLSHGPKVRQRPIASVIATIRHVRERYGGRYFLLADDYFLFDKEHARELLKAMAREDIRFFCESSVRVAEHEDLFPLLKAAGCVAVFLGVESVDQGSLASVNKKHNKVANYQEVFRAFDRRRIPVVASIIFGLDEDDATIFDRTLAFLETVKLQRTMFGIATPLPGTAFYERCRQDGRLITDDWTRYDGTHAVFRPRKMTPEELETGWARAQRQYYSLPAISRRLRAARREEFAYTLAMNLTLRRRVCKGQCVYHSGMKRIQ